MHLQLFLEEKFIGSLPIDPNLLCDANYIYKKKSELEEAYKELLLKSNSVPSFSILAHSVDNPKRKMMEHKKARREQQAKID